MACIYRRANKTNGAVWRVVFRRTGLPTICKAFLTRAEAVAYAKEKEPVYLNDPVKFVQDAEKEKLRDRHLRDRQRIIKGKYYK